MKEKGIRELYVIKDIIADDFGPVFEAVNEGTALRSFKRVVAKSDYPQDFQLYRIAYVDTDMVVVPELHLILEKEVVDDTELKIEEV